MRIYTKSGDEGETGLFLGGRVSKADPRPEAYGWSDSAVSAMGLARALCSDERVKAVLLRVQREMFTLGSELATDPSRYEQRDKRFAKITPKMVARLEGTIDELNAEMELPPEFIVPGASPGSGALDLARSMVRTSERRVVGLHQEGKLANPELIRYLNRLSDLLFMLARFEDRALPLELTKEED